MANQWLYGLGYLLIELAAVVAAAYAVMRARTSQGATAWAVGLVAFPLVTLPLFALFGRRKFQGYAEARAKYDGQVRLVIRRLTADHRLAAGLPHGWDAGVLTALERLAELPFTDGNRVGLLIDGTAGFDAIFTGIEAAKCYVLVQFYIVRDDVVGRALKELLCAKARSGVDVRLLYDRIGSHALPASYVEDLRQAGVAVEVFTGSGKIGTRLQINFRNHRKIVVVDGYRGYVGGLNVGDEYLGQDPKLSPWRDTHLCIEGPAVLGLQMAFVEDWYWATHELPELDWKAKAQPAGDCACLVVPSGPADQVETCSLLFVHAIHSSRSRLWIVSPYFVPDESVVSALQLAALRGVDVRVLVPARSDNRLVHLASWSYLEEVTAVGVRVFRYTRGFLHQKVMLIDDDLAAVGTANLDNRSFRLNFELTALVADRGFAASVEDMLEVDFAASALVTPDEIAVRSRTFWALAQLARLLAPVL